MKYGDHSFNIKTCLWKNKIPTWVYNLKCFMCRSIQIRSENRERLYILTNAAFI